MCWEEKIIKPEKQCKSVPHVLYWTLPGILQPYSLNLHQVISENTWFDYYGWNSTWLLVEGIKWKVYLYWCLSNGREGKMMVQWQTSEDGFWWFWPVNDATHVDLQVAVISQQSLLHHNQVHWLVLQAEETHAALKDVEGIFTFLTVLFSRTTWTGKKTGIGVVIY